MIFEKKNKEIKRRDFLIKLNLVITKISLYFCINTVGRSVAGSESYKRKVRATQGILLFNRK